MQILTELSSYDFFVKYLCRYSFTDRIGIPSPYYYSVLWLIWNPAVDD